MRFFKINTKVSLKCLQKMNCRQMKSEMQNYVQLCLRKQYLAIKVKRDNLLSDLPQTDLIKKFKFQPKASFSSDLLINKVIHMKIFFCLFSLTEFSISLYFFILSSPSSCHSDLSISHKAC